MIGNAQPLDEESLLLLDVGRKPQPWPQGRRALVVQLPLRFPWASMATMPIVSWFHSPDSSFSGANGPWLPLFSILMIGLYSDFFNQFS